MTATCATRLEVFDRLEPVSEVSSDEFSGIRKDDQKIRMPAAERRVGVEIEFGGVGLRETAELIQKLFGGVIKSHHRFAFKVESTRYGDFDCDSDASFVRDRKWQKYLDALGARSKSRARRRRYRCRIQ